MSGTVAPNLATPAMAREPAARDLAPARPRMLSIDILRGAVMVLMAIDHVRVFLSAEPLANLSRISASLFLTRWVTHFCAPVFLFLAGTAAFFYGRRVQETGRLARFLVTRGLWLVLMELTLVRLGWTFNFRYDQLLMAGVIWAIGICLILMAALVYLPRPAIALVGFAIVAGHNLLDPVAQTMRQSLSGSDLGWLWQVLYFGGPIQLGTGGPVLAVLYSIVPWIGVMALGYALGTVLELPPARRRQLCLRIGLGAVAAFLIIRGFNLYGNPRPWSPAQRAPLFAAFSFIDTNKYPASLLFLLMTLGPAIALIPALERVRGRLADALSLFGRVPFFYYLLHLPLIHGIAVVLAFARHGRVDPWLFGNHPIGVPPTPAGLGYGVPVLLLTTLVTVVLLYFPCRWFAAIKSRRRESWLSLL
ncbi:MAG TPA: heparan-alpha-glucosaminide N-acetyltransferase domain-containing protein [Gemmatimonadales bacterium]